MLIHRTSKCIHAKLHAGAQIADDKSGDSITVNALLKAGGIKAEAGTFTILSYRITMDGAVFVVTFVK
ncbi:MAG TPA: hypothetical protein VJ765_07925 [Chitinophagaceae bacterium]|nr:hypothetical protein [Chitinophagaceae bacterium]